MHETNIFLRKSTNCVRAQTFVNTKEMLVNTKETSAGINKERSQDALPANLGTPHIYLLIYNKVETSPIYNKV